MRNDYENRKGMPIDRYELMTMVARRLTECVRYGTDGFVSMMQYVGIAENDTVGQLLLDKKTYRGLAYLRTDVTIDGDDFKVSVSADLTEAMKNKQPEEFVHSAYADIIDMEFLPSGGVGPGPGHMMWVSVYPHKKRIPLFAWHNEIEFTLVKPWGANDPTTVHGDSTVVRLFNEWIIDYINNMMKQKLEDYNLRTIGYHVKQTDAETAAKAAEHNDTVFRTINDPDLTLSLTGRFDMTMLAHKHVRITTKTSTYNGTVIGDSPKNGLSVQLSDLPPYVSVYANIIAQDIISGKIQLSIED